jgi:pimeloyl-ACP methyl ester carboxylesterase
MQYAHVNGTRLHYVSAGEGEPLVLVHGGWSDLTTWELVVPALAEHFHVVAYDRRGHGRSERPSTQGSRREDEDDLAALIDHLGSGPAHVAGNSFGALIAIGLATRRPELFRTLTAHEPPLMQIAMDDPGVQRAAAICGRVAEQIEAGDAEGATTRFVEQIALGPGGWDMLPEPVRQRNIAHAPTFLDEQRDPHWSEVDLSPLMPAPMPILLSEGDQSPEWLRVVAGRLAYGLPDAAWLTLAGEGHVPHFTNPEAYVEAVTSFIGRAAREEVGVR